MTPPIGKTRYILSLDGDPKPAYISIPAYSPVPRSYSVPKSEYTPRSIYVPSQVATVNQTSSATQITPAQRAVTPNPVAAANQMPNLKGKNPCAPDRSAFKTFWMMMTGASCEP